MLKFAVVVGGSRPSRLGNYSLLHHLGGGGQGDVYIARRESERVVQAAAVKLMKRSDDQYQKGIFLNEMQTAAHLRHPCIVHLLDFGEIDGVLYLAMEPVCGITLSQLLRRCRLRGHAIPRSIAAALVADACDGLDEAHRTTVKGKNLGIVHRDIKPSNLMISDRGLLKIIDFGVAACSHRIYESISGVVRGTLLYMSPEQASGRVIDARADVFSASATLYNLVTGRTIYDGCDGAELHAAATKCRIAAQPRQLDPSIPAELEAILMRGLALEPNERQQTAAQLAKELRAFVASTHERIDNEARQWFLDQLVKEELEQIKLLWDDAASPTPAPTFGPFATGELPLDEAWADTVLIDHQNKDSGTISVPDSVHRVVRQTVDPTPTPPPPLPPAPPIAARWIAIAVSLSSLFALILWLGSYSMMRDREPPQQQPSPETIEEISPIEDRPTAVTVTEKHEPPPSVPVVAAQPAPAKTKKKPVDSKKKKVDELETLRAALDQTLRARGLKLRDLDLVAHEDLQRWQVWLEHGPSEDSAVVTAVGQRLQKHAAELAIDRAFLDVRLKRLLAQLKQLHQRGESAEEMKRLDMKYFDLKEHVARAGDEKERVEIARSMIALEGFVEARLRSRAQ